MAYDFTTLSPDDFEELASDLLSRDWGVRLESFKPGKDKGIDPRNVRTFAGAGVTVVQCKRYSNAINLHIERVPVDAADAARKGIASACAISNAAHPYSKALFRSTQEAFIHGWQQAMWAGVIAMMIVLVCVLVRGPERASLDLPE